MAIQKDADTLDEEVIKLIKEKDPNNVEELIKLIQLEKPSVSEKLIRKTILQLESQGKIKLKKTSTTPSLPLGNYLTSPNARWYWITILLALITTIAVFVIQDNSSQLMYIRNILGAVFVLFLPGYSFIKALFPEKELDNIERIALSMGMSLALVPITGLVLNYTPLGIRVTPITLSLLALTAIFATIAIIREQQSKK